MSLRWKGGIGRRFKEADPDGCPASSPTGISFRRVELELGIKAICGLLPPPSSSPTSSSRQQQPPVCVTWRKNGKLDQEDERRRQREGTTLTTKVGMDGMCVWEAARMTIIQCNVRKYVNEDMCDHRTVSFYVNQVCSPCSLLSLLSLLSSLSAFSAFSSLSFLSGLCSLCSLCSLSGRS